MTRKQYTWQLPTRIEQRLGDSTYGRQRTIQEDDDLLIILHEPPGADDKSREPKVFWRRTSGELLCNGSENGPVAMKALLAKYESRLNALEDACRKADSAKDYFNLLDSVAPVNRAAGNLYTTLQCAREQTREDRVILESRDRAYDLHRNFELLLSDAKSAMDYKIAKNAEEQVEKANEAVRAQHRLNILAAVFFPLTAVATIFGMNFKHGFESSPPVVFWAVLGAGILLGIAFKKWVTGRGGDGSSPDSKGKTLNRDRKISPAR